MLSLYYLYQKSEIQPFETRWSFIDNSTRDTMSASLKIMGQSIINWRGVIAVNDEANIIKTEAWGDCHSIVVINSKIDHIEQLPYYSLATSISIENIHTCQVI